MKYKVISTKLNHLRKYIGMVGKLQRTVKTGQTMDGSLVYYALRFKDSIAWFLEDEIEGQT